MLYSLELLVLIGRLGGHRLCDVNCTHKIKIDRFMNKLDAPHCAYSNGSNQLGMIQLGGENAMRLFMIILLVIVIIKWNCIVLIRACGRSRTMDRLCLNINKILHYRLGQTLPNADYNSNTTLFAPSGAEIHPD